MANENNFKPMVDPTAAKIAIKVIEAKGKMTRIQCLMDIWVPTSQIVVTNDNVTCPMWLIQKSLK